VLSVCSGVGGLDLGLERAGMTVVGLCEIDRHARAVLAHHWPGTPCHHNLTTLDGRNWNGRVDLVAGGTPCTDLSVAGRRAGLVGIESRLFWDFCRVAADSSARWVLWENVAGALSSNNGRDFAAVLWGLSGHMADVPEDGWRSVGVCVGMERAVVWRLLDARWFGVAQRRRRVFAVGCPVADVGRAISVLLEPESLPGHSPPCGEAGEDVASTLDGGAGSRGWAPDTDRMTFVSCLRASSMNVDDNTAQDGHLVPISFAWMAGVGSVADEGETCHTLISSQHPAVAYPLAMRGRGDGAEMEVGSADVYNALRAGNGGSSRQNGVLTPDLCVRRLTPVECERLMGWPDDHTRWGVYNGVTREVADSHRYRMCGNGVVAACTEWIGRRFMAVTS
jgi:DNA (cytosine-5)-methyltransferase 1